ncbi:MAG: signal recognition particle protein Srp54 [Halobacteriales archaeon]
MVLDELGGSLRETLRSIRGQGRLDEDDVEAVVKDIQRSLLQADVDVDLVMDLSESIRTRALQEEPPPGTPVADHVLKIVYEELVAIVGESTPLPLEPQVILLAGLQGSGKTTTAAKVAWWFDRKGLPSAVVQTDTFRPGAYEQAEEMAERAGVDFYGDPEADDPVAIARDGLEAVGEAAEVTIVDTAGRHALEDDLIEEMTAIEAAVDPDFNLLVLDAAIGQGAREQARQFEDAIGVDGVVITKLDGTAKGGGALTAVAETDSTIAFLGTGETVRDIERFEPGGFISRLLGMGDLEQLAERVERAMAEAEAADQEWDPESILEGEFTLVDMRNQLEAMQNMGPLDQVMDLIPGFGSNLRDQLPDEAMDVTDDRLHQYQVAMDSMTDAELEDPSVIGQSRLRRIARGSGIDEGVIRELLEQYRMMERTLKQFQGMGEADMQRMMKRLQQQGGGGGLGPF